jgi:Kdo2-lipid IVA lauroyltransferase/acyltransferase
VEQVRSRGKGVKDPKNTPSFWEPLFLTILNLIPLGARVWLFRRVAEIAYFLDERHRRIALRNLAIAFPERREKAREKIAKAAFRQLGTVLAEFPFIPKLNRRNVEKFIWIEGVEHFHKAKEKGRGILFLTAHFGNWEWMAASFPLLTGHSIAAVFRPIDNPFVGRLVERLRTCTGNQGISKEKAMARILRVLKKGEAVGILLDQNVSWQEGVFVKFFGEWACTNEGLALLALKTGAAVVPGFNIRQPDGRYRVVFEPEISLIRTENKEHDLQANTELFTRVIERYVREYPDHWLWLHQRWKTRPWQSRKIKETGEESHEPSS